jgi:ABC-type nitrate/sulfonate/bicarbonate transport system substrate-binding protein/outer membrane protein OmpA-like peptidoglycan-associated protein
MNPFRCLRLGLLAAAVLLTCHGTQAEEPFAKKVGDVTVGDVKASDAYDLPFLTWGGDVATFIANGGKDMTKKDTLFEKQGVKVKLVPGDDFVGQVKNYLEGKTPYIRGTLSQLGQASEVLGKDAKTKPVVFLQLTWSAGDHMIARANCKTTNDLKGKKIALQYGGPHVGMLDDILRTAGLTWKDIKVVWTDEVTGDKGPGALFRKDMTIDACFAITPDMLDLTGGLDKVGDGSEKSVKGAKVLVSTVNLNHSIADVYACRKDFYDKNKEAIGKLTAAYLKACEDLVDMRNNHDAKDKKDKALDDKYKAVLKMTQEIYGKDVIPDFDAAHGLILDAQFVGLPGNNTFFKDKDNPVNFVNRMKAAVDMAVKEGYASKAYEPAGADLDYDSLKTLAGLKLAVKPKDTAVPVKPPVNPEDIKGFSADKDTIVSFVVLFAENETNFNQEKYKAAFQDAVNAAKLYGNSVIQVRGHVDPSHTLFQFVQAGVNSGALRRTEVDGKKKYFLTKTNMEIDLADTKKVLMLIDTPDFQDKDPLKNPKSTVDEAKKLSEGRAAEVRKAVLALATANGVKLDTAQFSSGGVGIAEPAVAKPGNADEAAKNRRVEFRILKVNISPERPDFDY